MGCSVSLKQLQVFEKRGREAGGETWGRIEQCNQFEERAQTGATTTKLSGSSRTTTAGCAVQDRRGGRLMGLLSIPTGKRRVYVK